MTLWLLEDEFGHKLSEVRDPKNMLLKLFHEPQNATKRLFKYFDQYMDTVLNPIQASDFIEDLELLRNDDLTEEQKGLIEEIIRLAEEARRRACLYLRYRGD